jgi:hypothetical protein
MARPTKVTTPERVPLTDREKYHAAADFERGTFASIEHAEAFRHEVRDRPELYHRYVLCRAAGEPYA